MTSWKKSCTSRTLLCLAAVFMLVCALLSVCLGASGLTPAELGEALLDGGRETAASRILWYVRLPRTAACLLAGAGLAVSGAVIQGVLANPLASPGIIGVNAGAGLAVSICCACGASTGWMIAGSSFTGAMLAVLLVVGVSQKTGASRTTVVLGGVAVSNCMNAVSETIAILAPDASIGSTDFRVGGFSSVSAGRLAPAAVLIVLGLILALMLCNELDVIALGEDTAQGLGLRVSVMRPLLLGIAALLAGASVSFAGLLGFVGLIVPHMVRRLVGGESARLLPLCMFFGAGFVTLCDLASRLLFAPYELPTGILLSFIGGPFFIYLLLHRKRGESHD